MSELLTRRFLGSRRQIARALTHSFPRASAQDVEDALYDAYAELLARPPAGEPRVGLIYVAAWRRLRGTFRRHARRFERSVERHELVPASLQRPGQEVAVTAARWLAVFERVAEEQGRPHADAVRRAMLDKMETGDSDGEVAARHGLRRERVNRCWRAFLDALLPS